MATNSMDLLLRIRAQQDGSISVIPRTSQSVRDLDHAASTANRSLSGMAVSALDVNGAARVMAGGLSAVALVAGGRHLIDYADSLVLVDARVKVATSSVADYAKANQALVAVSLESHSSLSENANLFARTHKSIEQMGGSLGNTIAFSDALAKSLAISGASAGEAASVIRQMSQAFASGVLRGDEFNSLMENGSRMAFALADGLGVGVGELRKMAEAGELTAPKVLQATLSQAEKINEEFRQIPLTVASAWTDIETQFGRYVSGANQAHSATSTLAHGLESVAHNLPQVLDGGLLVAEGLAFALTTRGITSLVAYTSAQLAARAARAADAEVLAAHSAALVEDARRTTAQTAATVARVEAEIAATQATLAGTLSMGERMAATNTLNLQTRALTAATEAQTVAQAQLDAAIAANTVRLSAMTVAMGALNVAFAGVMGYQFGGWLNSFDFVANTATESAGRWAHTIEDWSHPIEAFKQTINDGWVSDWVGDLFVVDEAYKRNSQAIDDNVQSTIDWRAALAKSGMSAEQYKSYLLDLQTPSERFNSQTAKATQLFNDGLLPIGRYIEKLGLLRNEYDRLNEMKQAPLDKYLAGIQEKIDKIKLSPLDYANKYIPKDVIATGGEAQARAKNAELDAAQEAQKRLHEAEKAQTKERKADIKELEKAQQAYVEHQIKEFGRLAAAQLAEQADLQKQLEFDYRQGNVAFADYAAERERIIKQETAIKLAEYEKQLAVLPKGTGTATDIDTGKVTDQGHLAYFEQLAEKYGDLQQAAAEYRKTYQDITVTVSAGIADQEKVAELNEKMAQARRDEQTALADLHRAAAEQTQRDIESLTALNVKYIEVTGTARDAFLARQRANLAQPLKEAVLNQDWGRVDIIRNTAQAETQQFDSQRAQAYAEQLQQINSETHDLGITSSQAFDVINKGWGGLANTFDSWTAALDRVNDAIRKNGNDQQRLINDTSLSNDEWVGLMQANAQQAQALEKKRVQENLTGLRQIAGATADMFDKNSQAAQAFHKIEQVAAVAGIAMKVKEMAVSKAATAVKVAEGAATFFSQSGWGGFAGVAAMAAVLGVLGYSMAGGFNSHEPPPESSPDTGTVLGDSTKQSESVGNVVKTLNDIHASEYAELRGINTGINDLQAALSGTITRLFQAGGLDTSNRGINLTTDWGKREIEFVTSVTRLTSRLLIGPVGELFAGGYKSVSERGLVIGNQDVAGILAGAQLAAQQYNVVKTRTWDLFSDSTKYDTVFNGLDARLQRSLTDVFKNMGTVSVELATTLGQDYVNKVNAYQFPEIRVDLTNLNAEDASKKLNAVISTALDDMAETVFGKAVGQYQQLGEGMLETAARVVAEMAVVKDALHQSGLSMGKDAMAVSDALAVAAGGLKAFQDQFATYYDKFYSDTEKQARLQGQLAGQLMAVNMALPDTRDGYRDLVESLDINNAKDRERYSVLIKLAGAADEYYKALADGLDVYKSNIKSAYDTAAGLLKEQVDKYKRAIDQLKGFSDTLFNGPLSTATPVDKYLAAKGDFTEIQRVLKTGTAEQKAAALPNVQNVVQQFLDASRAYNAGSLPYMQDLAAAQALLGKSIVDAQGQKDVAQMQLDRLTDQVTALGLINTSTVSVKTAVDDVGKAINELVKYQAAQADKQNRARFDAQESARKAAYEAPIANRAEARAASASRSESMLGWSADTSNKAFSAQATIDASTGAITGGEAYASSSRHAGDVVDTLKNSGLAHVRAQFAKVGGLIEQIVGGTLPDVTVKIEAGNDPDPGKESYSFAGYAKSLAGDNPDPLLRLFAADAVDYLAGKIGDEAQAKAMKAVKFDSLPAGINALSTALDTLRKGPYQGQTYDPMKKYALGGVANTASIFGEAGPEAAVPLPDGRTIPVTLTGLTKDRDIQLAQLFYLDDIAASIKRQLQQNKTPEVVVNKSNQLDSSTSDAFIDKMNALIGLTHEFISVSNAINKNTGNFKASINDVEKAINSGFEQQMYVTINLPELQAKQAAVNARYDELQSAELSKIDNTNSGTGRRWFGSLRYEYTQYTGENKSEAGRAMYQSGFGGRVQLGQTVHLNNGTTQPKIDAWALDGNAATAGNDWFGGMNLGSDMDFAAKSLRSKLADYNLNLPSVTYAYHRNNGTLHYTMGAESGDFALSDYASQNDFKNSVFSAYLTDLASIVSKQLPPKLGSLIDDIDVVDLTGRNQEIRKDFFDAVDTAIYEYQHPRTDIMQTFAVGGIATKPSIFGEAGPEAAVPLPDGRTIPVTISGIPQWLMSPAPSQSAQPNGGGADLLQALQDVKTELAELRKLAETQNRHAAASVTTQQAGFKQTIANLEKQVDALNRQVRRNRIGADA